jgi:glycosyltransferase involved in cell wall biosynthesis
VCPLATGGARKLLAGLLLAKIAAMAFALFVYAKLVPLGDYKRYLSASVDLSLNTLTNRTLLADSIFSSLRTALGSEFLVHLTVAVTTAVVFWRLFRSSYSFVNKKLLWLTLLLPHFLIWTSIVGKEAIAVTGFVLVVKWCVNLAIYGRAPVLLAVVGLLLGGVMRPHYALAYGMLTIATWIIIRSPYVIGATFSLGVWWSFMAYVAAVGAFVLFITYHVWADFISFIMEVSQGYFLAYEARGNRHWIPWQDVGDFVANFSWGLPMAVVGPTPKEALVRPQLAPALLEGVVSLVLLGACFWLLMRFIRQNPRYRSLVFWGFLPAAVVALVFHYPFGLFNAGSAIRYKQSLVPLLYFYPLLLVAQCRRMHAQNLGPKDRCRHAPGCGGGCGQRLPGRGGRKAGAKDVEIIPTVVDTERYTPAGNRPQGPPVVGWIGTPKTSRYLFPLIPVFEQLRRAMPVRFVAVGARAEDFAGTPVEAWPWSEKTEVAAIQQFDIGIMPIDDTPWERGKCGYKLIQCMAWGVPVVASPVGVNREIVCHGENGFLADTMEEWKRSLERLVRMDPATRVAMGSVGRTRVERWHSLQVQAPRFLEALRRAAR